MRCENCGCQGIAGDLVTCPMCGHDLTASTAATDVDEQPAAVFATGGPVTGPGPLLVGEHGPEPVELPEGHVIDPHAPDEDPDEDAEGDPNG